MGDNVGFVGIKVGATDGPEGIILGVPVGAKDGIILGAEVEGTKVGLSD